MPIIIIHAMRVLAKFLRECANGSPDAGNEEAPARGPLAGASRSFSELAQTSYLS
jgi:hypothetical protein